MRENKITLGGGSPGLTESVYSRVEFLFYEYFIHIGEFKIPMQIIQYLHVGLLISDTIGKKNIPVFFF